MLIEAVRRTISDMPNFKTLGNIFKKEFFYENKIVLFLELKI